MTWEGHKRVKSLGPGVGDVCLSMGSLLDLFMKVENYVEETGLPERYGVKKQEQERELGFAFVPVEFEVSLGHLRDVQE